MDPVCSRYSERRSEWSGLAGVCCISLFDQPSPSICCRLWSTMGLDLQPDLCSLLIDDVIYHEAAVRQAGAEALSHAVARYQRQAAEVMGRLMEIYQEKLYVSSLCAPKWSEWCEGGLDSALTCSRQVS